MKKGDKVEYIGTTWPERVGWIGEIQHYIRGFNHDGGYYLVNFGGHCIRCYGNSLRLINAEKKKI